MVIGVGMLRRVRCLQRLGVCLFRLWRGTEELLELLVGGLEDRHGSGVWRDKLGLVLGGTIK